MFLFNQEPTDFCFLEHYIGNAMVSRDKISCSHPFLQQIFLGAIHDIMSQREPRKVRLTYQEAVYDNFEHEWKYLDNYIEFKNWRDDDDGVS